MPNDGLELFQNTPYVRACKIVGITYDYDMDGGAELVLESAITVHVNEAWMSSVNPDIGWYYVRLQSGHESACPAFHFQLMTQSCN